MKRARFAFQCLFAGEHIEGRVKAVFSRDENTRKLSKDSMDLNLFICDGSVFVTGGAVNPSLTIEALATRTAEHILEYGGAKAA
ncbi:MAG: hypothetical protein HS130_03910 [Deltaproteobacteria bacterium]|nr:hypothetical protein [Deltaproteobacteria bacterium]MCL4874354.1 hypothetical protein [bacterium]